MQLLSLGGQLLGALGVQQVPPEIQELLKRPEVQRYGAVLLGLLVLSQVIRVLASWGASKIVVKRDTATFGAAVKLWFGYLAFMLVLGFALSLVLPILFTLQEKWRIATACGGIALLSLIVFFLIPMKIYAVGFWRALGLLLLAGFMEGVVMSGLTLAAGPIFVSDKDLAALRDLERTQTEELRAKVDRLTGRDPAVEINRLLDEATRRPRKPLAEREAAVRSLQRKLDVQRRTLPPGNAAAAAVFRRQLDRYMQLLQEVKAERLATSAR